MITTTRSIWYLFDRQERKWHRGGNEWTLFLNKAKAYNARNHASTAIKYHNLDQERFVVVTGRVILEVPE